MIFDKTCGACPEQYNVLNDNGDIVAYARLRHGVFTVSCPDWDGECVGIWYPAGDGFFECHEREYFLKKAERKIRKYYRNLGRNSCE